MNKRTTQIALIGGFVVALGVTIYFWRKNTKQVSEKTDEEEGLKEEDKQVLKVAEPINSGDFLEKAKTLQSLLGFTGKDVDGDIGTNTKKRLSDKGLPTEITSANIDSVIAQLNAKTTEADKTKARRERALRLVKSASTKKMYTWIDKPSSLAVYTKDALGTFLKTNQILVVNKTDKFKIPIKTQTVLASGFVRAQIEDKDGRQRFIIVSPYSVTVF